MMKQLLLIAFSILLFPVISEAQTIWNGPTITFTKIDSTDWTQEANQDRITDEVWLTRQNRQGIFNIVDETSYSNSSPAGTEWAFGSTDDIDNLTFDTWKNTITNPTQMLDEPMVLHLTEEDIYIDIEFTAWTAQREGGGFTYERSTSGVASISENSKKELIFYPNPASDQLNFEKPVNETLYLYNIGGQLMRTIGPNVNSINVSDLPAGEYIIESEKHVGKFLKR